MGLFSYIIYGLLILQPALGYVQVQDLFPYGPQVGDDRVPTADDNFVNVTLQGGNRFNFFNRSYTELFVNNNGGISFVRGVPEYTPFCGPLQVPMIVPYWADVDTRIGGNVYYRQTTDATLRQKATTEVQRAFPGLRPNISWLFIATWDKVAFFGATANCSGTELRNTFQAILANDGNQSFAMFFYNNITWTTGTASGGDCYGRGGTPAKSGFDVADGQTFFSLPGTCTNDISNVTRSSNVNQDGKWIFKIDQSFGEPNSTNTTTPRPSNATNATTTITARPTTIFTLRPTTTMPATTPSYRTGNGTNSTMEECNPENCAKVGHCFEYSSCNPVTRRMDRWSCSDGLYWNPRTTGNSFSYTNATNATWGNGWGNGTISNNTTESGSCDLWEHLSNQTRELYRADRECFPLCYYKEIGECQGKYIYHERDTDRRDVRINTCPIDTRNGWNIPMVWVQERETCDFCYNTFTRNGNGTTCCNKYDQSLLPYIPRPPMDNSSWSSNSTG